MLPFIRKQLDEVKSVYYLALALIIAIHVAGLSTALHPPPAGASDWPQVRDLVAQAPPPQAHAEDLRQTEQHRRTLREAGSLLSQPIPDARKLAYLGGMPGMCSVYSGHLEAISRSADPATLQATYRLFQESRRLEVLHRLIRFTARPELQRLPHISGAPSVPAWDPTAQCMNLLGIIDRIAASEEPLRQAFWSTAPEQRDIVLLRLRFVAPYRDVASRVATLEAWNALWPQVARSDQQLAQSAETGVYDVELAKAIAGLPQEAQAWLSTRRTEFEAEVSKRRGSCQVD